MSKKYYKITIDITDHSAGQFHGIECKINVDGKKYKKSKYIPEIDKLLTELGKELKDILNEHSN